MRYHVHHLDQDLGSFTAEELQAARGAGRFTGEELIWSEGMPEWQALDTVFPPSAPPTLPPAPGRSKRSKWLVIAGVAAAAVVGLGIVIVVVVAKVYKRSAPRAAQAALRDGGLKDPAAEGVDLARLPVPENAGSFTYRDVRSRARAFREYQYVEGYRLNADHRAPCDKVSAELIRTWLDHVYGTKDGKPGRSSQELATEVAGNRVCDDGLALTVAALVVNSRDEQTRRLERALDAYKKGRHKAYPQLYATVLLSDAVHNQPERRAELDQAAVRLFGETLADGGLRPEDQVELGETLVFGWAKDFFARNRDAIHEIRDRGGAAFNWLSAVIDGQYHVQKAWEVRGGGFADSVSEQGMRGFQDHLKSAAAAFTKAWEVNTNAALPAVRMIHVAMGTGDTDEMRMWFDRALSAEIDNAEAWFAMRFALYPRWHGSLPALLALGETALNTERFDTDVPRKLFDCINDIESELRLPAGRRIYERPEVWPLLERMYRGYISAQANDADRHGWRSSFAIVSYLAGRNKVAREQLEAIDWNITKQALSGWNTDLSLMADEVAARTGPAAAAIEVADKAHAAGRLSKAADAYSALAARANTDARTREYVRLKLATIEAEKELDRGNWVPFLPSSANDPLWVVHSGGFSSQMPGTLDVSSRSGSHMLVSRMKVGTDFAIRGEWQKISGDEAYQAGFVFGTPDLENRNWYSVRMKNNRDDGPVAIIAHGWSRTQYVLAAQILPDAANTFEFRFKNNKATLILNNVTLYKNTEIPKWVNVNPDRIRIGIGAVNESAETTIRYGNLEIKRL